VHADETLKATIGGAGNIEYKGKAKVTQAITGGGSVDRMSGETPRAQRS
jgi:hypothetical protein